jgi:hypothetical protein
MIRFNAETERQLIFDQLMDVSGIFTSCNIGSYIKYHDCKLLMENDKACADEIVFEVTA